MREIVLRYLSWYRSFPALCVSTLLSTLEIKNFTTFCSDSLELYLLLFISPKFWV